MAEITRLVEPKEKTGLVVVITGHGKGKTTTAQKEIEPQSGIDY